MTSTKRFEIIRAMCCAGLTLALLGSASLANAQDREGRWELSLGASYTLGTDLDVEGGGALSTDDDFGFLVTGGYNFSDRLETTFGFQWAGIGYDANVFDEDDNLYSISGSFDTWTMTANAIVNLMDGQFTPYIGGGIGWTWVDTNVPTGPPVTGCWWDPFWGYICYTDYPTKTTDAFTYQATLGLRYEFDNDMTFMRFGYTSQWMDFDNAKGSPRFDVIGLEIGWKF